MNVTILGGGGFLGQKIAARLAGDPRGDRLTLFDLAAPTCPPGRARVEALAGDIAALPQAAIPEGTDIVFHLAAVVSAAAEADYELGRRVNLLGTDAVKLSGSGAQRL